MSVLSNPINKNALVLCSCWTLLVVCSFAWAIYQQKLNVLEIAKSEARIAFQKDMLYRKWAAKHGGVFVPVTPETQPNPYLPESLERNVTTPSGKPLTLINPAYMTRQVFELAAEGKDLIRGHITSLNPIRPENEPDPWERGALASFETGAKEASEVNEINGQQYLRLMRPFTAEQPCLKCHAEQGYKLGDIRGGISVSVPLSVLAANSNKIIAGTGTTHGQIWIMGLGIIGYGSRRLSKEAAALLNKNIQLEEEIAERLQIEEQLQEQAALLEEEILERQMAQETLQEQAVILEEEIAERARAEAELVLSEEKFSKTFQNAPLLMAITKIEDGTFLDVNNKFIELSGYTRDEVIGRTSLELGWLTSEARVKIVEECQRHGRVAGMELKVHSKDGREFVTQYYGELFSIDGHLRFLSVCLDLSEQRKLESQLLHAQKMEAVGTLAGGVAHDFNNILTVISGYTSLLSMQLEPNSRASVMVDEIAASVDRAAEMTRSLLAFSRKGPMSMKPQDVNRIIATLEKSLRRLIREDIEFKCTLSNQPTPVMADKGQLEQVLINLVVNARDAMPSGGVLSITSSVVEVHRGEIGLDESISQGMCSLITVSDTGVGMDNTTRDRIFEPFFTTKDVHKGTGLGLSIVHGIITTHNGSIHVYSEKGHGTTFRIYLPLIDQLQSTEKPETLNEILLQGNETILLADDDVAVQQVTTMLLESSGYKVIVADNGEKALSLFKENQEVIQLLITDVIMPRMNGKVLYEEISKLDPNIPAIFMSGYSGEIIDEKILPPGKVTFLSKPIKANRFLIAIRQMLDRPQGLPTPDKRVHLMSK